MPYDPDTGDWVDSPAAQAMPQVPAMLRRPTESPLQTRLGDAKTARFAKIDAYRAMMNDRNQPVTEANSAGAWDAGMQEDGRRKAAYDASPVGAFQNRMKSLANVDRGTLGGERDTRQPGTEAGSGTDADPTQIYNPNANRVRIMGNEAMGDGQRATIERMANNDFQGVAPLVGRNETTGKSFYMPGSGPRVSAGKAQSYLALQQDKEAKDKAQAQTDFQNMTQQEAITEANRVRALNEKNAGEDRAQAAVETGRRRAREDTTNGLNDRLMNAKVGVAQRDLDEGLSPQATQQIHYHEEKMAATKDPQVRAYHQRQIEQLGHMPTTPEDIAGLENKVDPNVADTEAAANLNSSTLGPMSKALEDEAVRLYKTRAVTDDSRKELAGKAFKSLIPGYLPYQALFGDRKLTSDSTDKFKTMLTDLIDQAKRRDPTADEATIRQIIKNRVHAAMGPDATGDMVDKVDQILGSMPAVAPKAAAAPSRDPSLFLPPTMLRRPQ